MIRAVLNFLSCSSENHRNRRVLNFVLVCLLPVLFVRLWGSKLASMWLLTAFCVDLATSSCGQLFFKISVLGSYFLYLLMFLVFSRQ